MGTDHNPPNGEDEQQVPAQVPALPDPESLVVVDPATGQRLGPVTQFEVWRSGPLPTAQELADYNAAVPGLANRIIERWESETDHRREMERAVIQAGVALQRNGQRIAAAIAVLAVVGGIVLAALGKNVAGLASILTPLALIALAFIWGQVRSRTDS